MFCDFHIYKNYAKIISLTEFAAKICIFYKKYLLIQNKAVLLQRKWLLRIDVRCFFVVSSHYQAITNN